MGKAREQLEYYQKGDAPIDSVVGALVSDVEGLITDFHTLQQMVRNEEDVRKKNYVELDNRVAALEGDKQPGESDTAPGCFGNPDAAIPCKDGKCSLQAQCLAVCRDKVMQEDFRKAVEVREQAQNVIEAAYKPHDKPCYGTKACDEHCAEHGACQKQYAEAMAQVKQSDVVYVAKSLGCYGMMFCMNTYCPVHAECQGKYKTSIEPLPVWNDAEVKRLYELLHSVALVNESAVDTLKRIIDGYRKSCENESLRSNSQGQTDGWKGSTNMRVMYDSAKQAPGCFGDPRQAQECINQQCSLKADCHAHSRDKLLNARESEMTYDRNNTLIFPGDTVIVLSKGNWFWTIEKMKCDRVFCKPHLNQYHKAWVNIKDVVLYAKKGQ
jgi:hypothetical protein